MLNVVQQLITVMNVINDWPGCTSCNYGYTVEWNSNCGVNVCVANIYL